MKFYFNIVLFLFILNSFGNDYRVKKVDLHRKTDKSIYIRLELVCPDSNLPSPVSLTIEKKSDMLVTYPDGQIAAGIHYDKESILYREPIEILFDQTDSDWYFVVELQGYFKEKMSISNISQKFTKMVDAGEYYIIPLTIYMVTNRNLPKMYNFSIRLKYNFETKEYQYYHFNPDDLKNGEINRLISNTKFIKFDKDLDEISKPEDLEAVMWLALNEAGSDSGFIPFELDYPHALPMLEAPLEGYVENIPIKLGDTRNFYYFKILGRYGRIQVNQVYVRDNELHVVILCKINRQPNIRDIRNHNKY